MLQVLKGIVGVILQLLGCTILGIGIWLHIAKGNYAPLMPNFSYLSASALCMSAGAVMLLVGFFGCCGAIMEHQCLLITVSHNILPLTTGSNCGHACFMYFCVSFTCASHNLSCYIQCTSMKQNLVHFWELFQYFLIKAWHLYHVHVRIIDSLKKATYCQK